MSEKKTVRRSVAIGLGIICIVVVAGLVGALAYYNYTPIINDKDKTISSLTAEIGQLNSEINQLNSTILNLQGQVGVDNLTINLLKANLTNLQDQLNWLLNVTTIPIETITSNPSAWVNRTVVVQGVLTELPLEAYLPWQLGPPWNHMLNSSKSIDQIGVLWNGSDDVFSQVQISGIVRQGMENLNGTNTTVFYIEALTIDPFAVYINLTLGATP